MRKRMCSGMAVALAAGLPITPATGGTYEWWSPTSAPVTGNFATTANWENFVRPSTSPGAFNHLEFLFADPQSFTANNNLQSGLNVASISAATGEITATITGSRLYLTPMSLGGPKCRLSGPSGYGALVLETPLSGGTGFEVVEGRVILDPSSASSHTITGGIVVSGGELRYEYPSDTGAVSNTITVNGGVLRNTGNAPLSVPLIANGGALETDAGKYLRLWTPIQGSGTVTKTGLGILDLVSLGSTAEIDWHLDGGIFQIIGDAAGTGSVTVHPSSDLVLTGDATLSHLVSMPVGTFRGAVNLEGHELTLTPGTEGGETALPRFFFDGTLRIAGDHTYSMDGNHPYQGGFIVEQGTLRFEDDADLPNIGACTATGSGTIDFGSATMAVPSLTGNGMFRFADGGEITVQPGTAYDLTGRLEGPAGAGVVLDAGGIWYLSGNNSGYEGRIELSRGKMYVSSANTLPAGELHVPAGARLEVRNHSSIDRLSGDGVVFVSDSRVLTVGASGGDSTFSGTMSTPNIYTRMEKKGGGTFGLAGDISGFRGSLHVDEGAVRLVGVELLPESLNATLLRAGAALKGYGSIPKTVITAGRITADVDGEALVIRSRVDRLNSVPGVVEAINGGVIQLTGARVEHTGGGVLRAGEGSEVRFEGVSTATVIDGVMETEGSGEIVFARTGCRIIGPALRGNVVFESGGDCDFYGVSWTMADDDTLTIEAGGPSAVPLIQTFDPVSSLTMNGTLKLDLADGYTPSEGDRIQLVQRMHSGSLVLGGAFDQIDTPDISPLVWKIVDSAWSVDIIAACPVDIAAPFGLLDLNDVSAFVSAFAAGDSLADLDGNGLNDLTDIGMFVSGFTSCP